ncbi:MAG: TRAP transporter large permease subunit [Pseudomonadota bacterium]
MMFATVYDVGARYLFNRPTIWATEISTYLLITAIFCGASYAHLTGANVRVEVLIRRLSPARRGMVEAATAWLALIFVALTGWQAVLLVISDYEHNSRLFSLLLTPSWMPKTPIAMGMIVLAAAVLVEIERLGGPGPAWRRSAAYGLAAIVTIVLLALGPEPPMVGWLGVDVGSMLVLAAIAIGAFIASGRAVGTAVLGAMVVSVLVYELVAGWGVTALTVLILATIAGLLAVGMRIAFALGLIGLICIYLLTPTPFPITLPDRTWGSVNSFALTAVPLYVLMGALLIRSGLSSELFSVMARALARLPGGLAQASAAGCAVFAAVSGSSVATAATIGTVACPEMTKRGYSPGLTYGVVAAGGTLGILIPPSVPLIIYGTTAGVPVATLFIAGIVPGLLLVGIFMLVILVWVVMRPQAAPRVDTGSLAPLGWHSLIDTLLVILLILMIILSLYGGLATPSETGALGAFFAAVICLARRRLNWRIVRSALAETVVVTAFIFMIVVGAHILTFGFDYLRLSRLVLAAVTDADVGRWLILALMLAVYLVLGMFLDSISMLVLTLPVAFPLIVSLGFDPVWFGIILVIVAEAGLITPPVGMNLFVLQGIAKTVTIRTIAIGTMPFLAAMGVTILLLCFFPEIALWLTAHLE